MAKSFEDLIGGMGRKIYFRSNRYPAKELIHRTQPVLLVDNRRYKLHDLSMNGLAFMARPGDEPFQPGTELAVALKLDDHPAYEGRGQVLRVEPTERGFKVALKITEGFLNIPTLVTMHDELALKKELHDGAAGTMDQVPPAYKEICADVVVLFRRYRSIMERFEEQAATRSEASVLDYDAFPEDAMDRFRQEWLRLRERANDEVLKILDDRRALLALKKYTEMLVTPEFMDAPNWRRSYEKPLGYPGDYAIMNYFYSGAAEGDGLFAKMVHRLGNEHPTPNSIPLRMRVLLETIERTASTMNGGREVRITSLGCGPAREVAEYLKTHQNGHRVAFTLIDQDEQALSHAYSQIYPLMCEFQDRVRANCLHLSFSQLIRDPAVLEEAKDQDLIYSSGLFDYLPQEACKFLISNLYQRLVSGGLLTICNVLAPTRVFWSPEFILDWSMIYRTKEEMLDMASGAPGAEVDVGTDSSGHIYVLNLRKPQEAARP